MTLYSGNLEKLKTNYDFKKPVEYSLVLGDQLINLNSFIGKKIKMSFEGRINCVATGELIKKSFNQGYSYKAFMSLAECDSCIMSPEKCHFHKGTCRNEEWGKRNCMIEHYVYLANTGDVKVGITRHTQIPTRWIDQGASWALPILKVKDRYTSGLVEHEIKKFMNDKTNWQKMLKNEINFVDLIKQRDDVFDRIEYMLDDEGIQIIEEKVVEIIYPVEKYPIKVKSLNFDKSPVIEGTLEGIKGQYLILDTGCVNIRRHGGYFINIDL